MDLERNGLGFFQGTIPAFTVGTEENHESP
jgi:hypothetical protein